MILMCTLKAPCLKAKKIIPCCMGLTYSTFWTLVFFSYQGYGFMISWLTVSRQLRYLLITITKDNNVIFTLM